MGERVFTGLPEALHIHCEVSSQVRHQVGDMYSGPAVDVWRPLAGQNPDTHSSQPRTLKSAAYI